VTCEEFQEVVAAYALGAVDREERAACEAHLVEATHRGCEEAYRRALATVAAMAGALPRVAPGDGVWRAIEARIGTPERPVVLPPRRRSLGWVTALAAAAALVFAVLWIDQRRTASRDRRAALDEIAAAHHAAATAQQRAEADAQARAALEGELRGVRGALDAQRQVLALLGAPGSRVVSLDPQPGRTGRASAVVNLEQQRAIVVSGSLPPPDGKTYQLWVIRGTAAPTPAGFLNPSDGGLLLGQIDPALLAAAPDALAVSLEPPGGSPAPTDVQLVGKLAG
jgi:anti-sigma-K factor RskA